MQLRNIAWEFRTTTILHYHLLHIRRKQLNKSSKSSQTGKVWEAILQSVSQSRTLLSLWQNLFQKLHLGTTTEKTICEVLASLLSSLALANEGEHDCQKTFNEMMRKLPSIWQCYMQIRECYWGKKSLLVFDVPNWVFTTFRNRHWESFWHFSNTVYVNEKNDRRHYTVQDWLLIMMQNANFRFYYGKKSQQMQALNFSRQKALSTLYPLMCQIGQNLFQQFKLHKVENTTDLFVKNSFFYCNEL